MMMTMTMTILAMMDGWMDDMTDGMREGKGSSPRTKKTVGKERSPCKRHSLLQKEKPCSRSIQLTSTTTTTRNIASCFGRTLLGLSDFHNGYEEVIRYYAICSPNANFVSRINRRCMYVCIGARVEFDKIYFYSLGSSIYLSTKRTQVSSHSIYVCMYVCMHEEMTDKFKEKARKMISLLVLIL